MSGVADMATIARSGRIVAATSMVNASADVGGEVALVDLVEDDRADAGERRGRSAVGASARLR